MAPLTLVTGPSNRSYAFIYAAKDQQLLQRACRQMQEAESSFRALTAAERSAAHPWQLKTVPYPRRLRNWLGSALDEQCGAAVEAVDR